MADIVCRFVETHTVYSVFSGLTQVTVYLASSIYSTGDHLTRTVLVRGCCSATSDFTIATRFSGEQFNAIHHPPRVQYESLDLSPDE